MYFRIGVPLPRPINDNGPRIYFVKYEGDVSKGLVDMNELYSVIIAMHEIMIMEDPYACINGIIYILDLKDCTAEMAAQFSPQFLMKVVHFFEHSLPFYVRSANFLNFSTHFQNSMDILMSMFSERFKQRVYKLFKKNNFLIMFCLFALGKILW